MQQSNFYCAHASHLEQWLVNHTFNCNSIDQPGAYEPSRKQPMIFPHYPGALIREANHGQQHMPRESGSAALHVGSAIWGVSECILEVWKAIVDAWRAIFGGV